MKWISYTNLYYLWNFFILIIESMSTRKTMRQISRKFVSKQEIVNYHQLLIYTKILLLFDSYHFVTFVVGRNMGSIIQLRVTKFLAGGLWAFLGIKIQFDFWKIIYYTSKIFSYFLLNIVINETSDYIYHQYNLKIGADMNVINEYIISQIIDSFKNAAFCCICIYILTDITIGNLDLYSVYSWCKFIVFACDIIINRRKGHEAEKFIISFISMSSLCVFGITYMIFMCIRCTLEYHIVYLFNEILLLIIVILMGKKWYMRSRNKQI